MADTIQGFNYHVYVPLLNALRVIKSQSFVDGWWQFFQLKNIAECFLIVILEG